MEKNSEKTILLRGLVANYDSIRDSFGEDWKFFSDFLLDRVLMLDLAEEDEEHELNIMREIIAAGLNSPASSHFEGIVDQLLEVGRLPRTAFVEPWEMAAKGDSEPRYFNVFFSDRHDSETVTPDRPLVFDTVYHLHLDINPERRGLGEDETSFPDEVLDEHWGDQDTLPLTITASSRDFEIPKRVDTLNLLREGPSEIMFFAVKPIVQGKRGYIQVEALYNGQLLQSKQVEAYIVEAPDAPVDPSEKVFQTARTTFTAAGDLMLHKLDRLPDRFLTINVERDTRDGSIDFRFLDRTAGGQEVAFYDTRLHSLALKKAVENVRLALRYTVTGRTVDEEYAEGYQWVLKDDGTRISRWLPELAAAGRYMYRAVLPESHGSPGEEDQGERLKAVLKPGAVIQVNPVVGVVTVPWAVMYERKVKMGDDTAVCDEYKSCGPDRADCPHEGVPEVVCPYSFWGYRYAIEQVPCWLTGESSTDTGLVREISNDVPLNLNFNVYRDFKHWEDHLNKLEGEGEIQKMVAEEISQLEDTWVNHGHNLDVIYFYSHGGVDEVYRQPYLEISDGQIDSLFLEACDLTWSHHPLVFLNGCSTGNYGPDCYVSLIDDFRKGGASGVVGTECPVPEEFAEAYASAFFPRLFDGEPLGKAMLDVRTMFLREYGNPLGLVYTLYAANEIALAKSVKKGGDGA